MQPPGVFNLTSGPDGDRRIVEGSDNRFTLAFDSTYGSDWSGYAARAELRDTYKSAGGTLIGSFVATITNPGPSARTIHFHLPYTVTIPVGTNCGVWDCEIYNGVSVVRVVQGEWEVNLEATT